MSLYPVLIIHPRTVLTLSRPPLPAPPVAPPWNSPLLCDWPSAHCSYLLEKMAISVQQNEAMSILKKNKHTHTQKIPLQSCCFDNQVIFSCREPPKIWTAHFSAVTQKKAKPIKEIWKFLFFVLAVLVVMPVRQKNQEKTNTCMSLKAEFDPCCCCF